MPLMDIWDHARRVTADLACRIFIVPSLPHSVCGQRGNSPPDDDSQRILLTG